MAYRGSTLKSGGMLTPNGDYLMSDNGRFVLTLQTNGALSVAWAPLPWTSPLQTPPGSLPGNLTPVWTAYAGGQDDGRYFLCMQTDGNLVLYRGVNFQDPQLKGLWSTLSVGNDGATALLGKDAVLSVSRGNSKLYPPPDAVPGYVTEDGDRRFLSGFDYSSKNQYGRLSISNEPSDDGSSILSMRTPPTPFPDRMTWTQLHWVVGGQTVGYVFLSKTAGLALASGGLYEGATLSYVVNTSSTWVLGGPVWNSGDYPPYIWAVSAAVDPNVQALNMKGDAPYSSGAAVLVWAWGMDPRSNQPPGNLVWQIRPPSDVR
jgi:hypothetical protein